MTDIPSTPDGGPFTAMLNGQPVLPEYLERFMASQQEPAYCIAGEEFARRRYGVADHGENPSATCRDCGAGEGQYHTIGCHLEECPRCLKQAIMCKCEPRSDRFATPAEAAMRK